MRHLRRSDLEFCYYGRSYLIVWLVQTELLSYKGHTIARFEIIAAISTNICLPDLQHVVWSIRTEGSEDTDDNNISSL
jgi:cytosine/uracil/thiamine/allantoin permease